MFMRATCFPLKSDTHRDVAKMLWINQKVERTSGELALQAEKESLRGIRDDAAAAERSSDLKTTGIWTDAAEAEMQGDMKTNRREDRTTEPEITMKMRTTTMILDSTMKSINLESKRPNGARRRKGLLRKLRPRRPLCYPST